MKKIELRMETERREIRVEMGYFFSFLLRGEGKITEDEGHRSKMA